MRGLCGVERASEEKVRAVIAPEPTETWHPISHNCLLDIVENTLNKNQLVISKKSFQLSHNNNRFFGVYDLVGDFVQDDFGLSLGIRNSTDQKFPAGLAFGTRVFVCSNLMFEGDEVVSRKHTRLIMNDLPIMVDSIIDSFLSRYLGTCRQIAHYKNCSLAENDAKAFLWDIAGRNILPYNFARKEVYPIWENPQYKEHSENTVWRLYNAITEAMKPRQDRNPHAALFETESIAFLMKEYWPLKEAVSA